MAGASVVQWPGLSSGNEVLVPGGVKLGTAVLRTVSAGLAAVMGAGMEAHLHLSVDPDRAFRTVDWSFGDSPDGAERALPACGRRVVPMQATGLMLRCDMFKG